MCVLLLYLPKLHVEALPSHVLFLDGLQANIDAIVDTKTWELTALGKEMDKKGQSGTKSCPASTGFQQAADLQKTHNLARAPYQNDEFATLDTEKKFGDIFTPVLVKDAIEALRKFGLPPASLDVMERVIHTAHDSLPACLTRKIVQDGFRKAHYPDVNVQEILKPCESFAALAQVHQDKIVELCETELTTEYMKHQWLSDGIIVATLERENIFIGEGGIFPLVNENTKPVNERRTLVFTDPIFREERHVEIEKKRDVAQALVNLKNEKKRKHDQEKLEKEKEEVVTLIMYCTLIMYIP